MTDVDAKAAVTARPVREPGRLSRDAIRAIVLEAVRAIAPECDVRAIPAHLPLRDAADLDSMDWLNVIDAAAERASVEIPPSEQDRLLTLDAVVDAIASRQAGAIAPADPGLPPPGLAGVQHVVRGTAVLIRPLRAQDRALEAQFVRRLSRASRYQRFMVTLNELPPGKLDELTHVDQQRHVALVATVEREGQPALIGVVRYVVDAGGTGCEFAVTIDDAWQGSGLAGILMQRLIGVARSRGLRTMVGLVLRTNARMLKLARQLGFRCERDPADRDTVRVIRSL